ncbi:MAG: ISAs1 family transposase, partial [Fimbriimonadaceae bacterium]|nr:ISAs1 family transposase [Fimbriimonadaceae bacterium]
MVNNTAKRSLIDHFSALDDPRQAWKVEYPLPEIMLLVLCATLAGADSFVDIRFWGRKKLDFLRTLLPFRKGIPSHDTLNDVMNALDPAIFSDCFIAWVEQLREDEPDIVALDGKTSRRARRGDTHPLHVVSAWAARQRLVLGQQAVDAKSNEIVAIPLLLERLQLTGALVTIDAIGCQTKIADAILAKGADYLLALKDNWPTLAAEVALYFDNVDAEKLDQHVTTDGDHGRIEVRRHLVSHEVDWLATDRRFPGEPRFPGLKAIAMVEATVQRDGKTSIARRFFLSSLPLDAKLCAKAVRAHWGIENRLHWVLDVVFHDDLMRLRTQNGPQNMAVVKHMAMNLVKAAPGPDSIRVRRKAAGWDDNYLRG